MTTRQAQDPAGALAARRDFRRRPRGLVIVAAIAAVLVGCGLAARLAVHATPPCQGSFVPAFFPPADWGRAAAGGSGPGVMILNPASGPGAAANPDFRTVVHNAEGSGSRVIGYIGTEYGQRPLWQSEEDVRNYLRWYGVRGIFLDQTPTSGTRQIGYYRSLVHYIHRLSPGAPVWLNPGVYPDRQYMSLGSVVMVFEGSYRTYLTQKVPRWVHHYRADKFAHTIYAAPRGQLGNAVHLSRDRHAGHVFVTDDVGPNPYGALPSYWSQERPAVASGCSARSR